MEEVIWLPLWYEAVEKNWYNIFLIYDKVWLINIIVNEENRTDILDEVLNKYCADEIELYSIHWELNINLLDLIYNHI